MPVLLPLPKSHRLPNNCLDNAASFDAPQQACGKGHASAQIQEMWEILSLGFENLTEYTVRGEFGCFLRPVFASSEKKPNNRALFSARTALRSSLGLLLPEQRQTSIDHLVPSSNLQQSVRGRATGHAPLDACT